MSRGHHLLAPLPPQHRSLWPTDTPVSAPEHTAGDALTQPRISLPWASGGPLWEPEEAACTGANPAALHAEAALPSPTQASPYSLQAHLSLAVALDVLASQLAASGASEAHSGVLSAITDALLDLRTNRSEDISEQEHDAQTIGAQLRDIAMGPIGEARAALAYPLSLCTQALGDAAGPAQGVALACAQVMAGAREVIVRARLALEAKEAKLSHKGPGGR